jgi:hypothetical protein
MISLLTARKLKEAGLVWLPQHLDYFAIPEMGLDDRVFVISDVLVTLEYLQAIQVVSFQGASEWALDYLIIAEAIWLPREDQVRQALEAALIASGSPGLQMVAAISGYQCSITYNQNELSFNARVASEAYAAALLYILKSRASNS